MYKSSFTPGQLRNHPEIKERLGYFEKYALAKIQVPSNQTRIKPKQTKRKLLQILTKHDDLIVTPCDKKSKPSIIKRDKYIHIDLGKHL